MEFLKKGVFSGGRKSDQDSINQMRMNVQMSNFDDSADCEMEKQVVIDYKQYQDLKFEDDLDSDKE